MRRIQDWFWKQGFQTQVDIFVGGSCIVTAAAGVLIAWMGH